MLWQYGVSLAILYLHRHTGQDDATGLGRPSPRAWLACQLGLSVGLPLGPISVLRKVRNTLTLILTLA